MSKIEARIEVFNFGHLFFGHFSVTSNTARLRHMISSDVVVVAVVVVATTVERDTELTSTFHVNHTISQKQNLAFDSNGLSR